MKKPRLDGSDRPAARARILIAAPELFAGRGFDGTSIKRISEAADVPPGPIYYYFGKKQELLRALLDERPFLPKLRAALEPSPEEDPISTLTDIGLRLYETVEREHKMARIVFRELNLNGEVADGFDTVLAEVCRS